MATKMDLVKKDMALLEGMVGEPVEPQPGLHPLTEHIYEGLDGVMVAHSTICDINSDTGTLTYRGVDIGDLARHSTYEETAYLLWLDAFPTRNQLAAFKSMLHAEREVGDSVWEILQLISAYAAPLDALRTAVSALPCCVLGEDPQDRETNFTKAVLLTAKMPTIVAYYHRMLEGKPRVHPDPTLGHAENFLYMLHGQRPTALEARAMDLAMLLMAEHNFNASTFAARVTTSTLSDMCSAITTAIGTLKGPLHGGANQQAMAMLLDIPDVESVPGYISAKLAAKQRIMGFGHRIYRKTGDPRSEHLKAMLYQLCAQAGNFHLYNLASAVAETVWQKKQLYPNVDFYAAPLMYMLGIPGDLFTPIFALSRIVGWTAHVMEQYANNRLMRPLCAYNGKLGRPYIPLEQRDGLLGGA